MTITKVTDFLRECENTLGWEPEPGLPAKVSQFARLKRKIATNPDLYTWRNLELTIELMRREQIPITEPLGVFAHVPRALAAAHQPVTGELAGRLHQAVIEAFLAGEAAWVERLSRATGDARHEVLAEWEAARDG